jgi:hypothetical protein
MPEKPLDDLSRALESFRALDQTHFKGLQSGILAAHFGHPSYANQLQSIAAGIDLQKFTGVSQLQRASRSISEQYANPLQELAKSISKQFELQPLARLASQNFANMEQIQAAAIPIAQLRALSHLAIPDIRAAEFDPAALADLDDDLEDEGVLSDWIASLGSQQVRRTPLNVLGALVLVATYLEAQTGITSACALVAAPAGAPRAGPPAERPYRWRVTLAE